MAKDVQYFQLPILGSALVTSWYISTLESYNYDSEKQSGLNTELTCDHNYVHNQPGKKRGTCQSDNTVTGEGWL